jgi:hypothetical protein
MTEQELHEEYMSDSTTYCCYCGIEQHSFGCCGENHFERFSEMSKSDQLNIIHNDDRLQTLP